MIAALAVSSSLGAGPTPKARTHVGEGRVEVPPPSPRAVEYHRSGLALYFVGRAWTLGVPALILFSGLAARIRDQIRGRGWPAAAEVAAFALVYLAMEFVVNLPWRYYVGFVRPHEYGLSHQSIGRWLGDSLKGTGVEMAAAALFLWVPYRMMARSPRRWWLWVGLLMLPFSAFTAVIAPVVIDPLYNHFGPMKDKGLEAKIDALARRSGIDGGKIFEVDKSRDTKTVNAYVTGLFGTRRIVLWDTLLASLDDEEVLVVMGHEMGHYVLNHVAIGITLSCFGSVFLLFAVDRLGNALIRRFHRRFGFDRLADVASLPLLILLVQGLILLTDPISHAVSRAMEHEADRFTLEITRSNHAAGTAFTKLQADNLSVPFPDPFTRIWRASHPSIGERIEFSNEYRPWESGRPPVYGDRFRSP